MAYKYFDFECSACKHVYECLVDSSTEEPDPCPACGGTAATKAVCVSKSITLYVPDYPGANYHRAGYTHLRRPAEKKGRQISMAGATSPSPTTSKRRSP